MERFRLGGNYLGKTETSFCVWAPHADHVDLVIDGEAQRCDPLHPAGDGYFTLLMDGLKPGTRYFYALNGKSKRPDPASRFQPEGVHGPSEIIDHTFPWGDGHWRAVPLNRYILYELHVGTFTREGTFEAIIPHLARLRDLGITAIELMPIAQFPGKRNWGYDGVYPFAVQDFYGGPLGLKRLVNACHQHGLSVVLDVVYNHFGPEGNYLREFGPYFTSCYKTPWGEAINFDGEQSDHVRRFFIENALYWQTEFHIDALRLDAVHAIRDFSAVPFLQELARATRRADRPFYLIAESDLNDPRLICPEATGGLGLDAQWSDDFHHCLHVLITGERSGYYEDFGGVQQLAKIIREGYAYTGEYSRFRKRRHGNSPALASPRQFIVFSQNHDQIGNRFLGERLSALTDFERLKLAAGAVVLSPFTPLLFMGEEYGEPAPFQYMISHTDPALVEAVCNGRREEFAAFEFTGDIPDPNSIATFEACTLKPDVCSQHSKHRVLQDFYRELIRLRKTLPEIKKEDIRTLPFEHENVLIVQYVQEQAPTIVCFNFAAESRSVQIPNSSGSWTRIVDSSDSQWNGPGPGSAERITDQVRLPPTSVTVLQRIS